VFSGAGLPGNQRVTQDELTDYRHVFLSTEFASRSQRRIGLSAVLISVVFFFVAVPFATWPLPRLQAFIAVYESTLVLSDLITAVLLFAQFNVLRSRALLVLASGYLFTALIAVSHALTFPELFSPSGLLGAGPQSTAWLYMFWHGGFPLFVILYALLKDDNGNAIAASGAPGLRRAGTGIAIMGSIATILATVCGLTIIATANHGFLAVLMVGNGFTPVMKGVVTSLWVMSLLAVVLLWRRRPHTVLDLWLIVVMCAWIFDIGVSAVLNAGRFDLGWYGGRLYGLLAAIVLLIVLLIENVTHYTRLAQVSVQLSVANKSLEQLSLHDGLTSLANRRFFDTYLADQIAIARRNKRILSLVLYDVDAFKAYNDHYGHQAGDECLQRIAAALQSCCRRPADMVARYGGEEFAMILPETELMGAVRIGEAARDAVAQLKILHGHSPAGPYVSISGGVAGLLPNVDITAKQLIMEADQTLYEAKDQGRNRIACVRTETGYEVV
jgi:diguanylate cyclase (GGDEF)-like protein